MADAYGGKENDAGRVATGVDSLNTNSTKRKLEKEHEELFSQLKDVLDRLGKEHKKAKRKNRAREKLGLSTTSGPSIAENALNEECRELTIKLTDVLNRLEKERKKDRRKSRPTLKRKLGLSTAAGSVNPVAFHETAVNKLHKKCEELTNKLKDELDRLEKEIEEKKRTTPGFLVKPVAFYGICNNDPKRLEKNAKQRRWYAARQEKRKRSEGIVVEEESKPRSMPVNDSGLDSM